MYGYDDFYNEPSEFEQRIDEFKESLYKCVKQEFFDEMKALRDENAELQGIKKNYKKIQADYAAKERDLEYEKRNLMSTVRRKRLSELMQDFRVIMYRATNIGVKRQKCDKCDDKRYIHFLSPTGKDTKEACECSYKDYKFVPEEYTCWEFKISDRNNKELDLWYKLYKEKDYDYYEYNGSSYYAKTIFKTGMDYKELSRTETFFKSEWECQKYCDWLNEQKN